MNTNDIQDCKRKVSELDLSFNIKELQNTGAGF
jgi:hypothetical protein